MSRCGHLEMIHWVYFTEPGPVLDGHDEWQVGVREHDDIQAGHVFL